MRAVVRRHRALLVAIVVSGACDAVVGEEPTLKPTLTIASMKQQYVVGEPMVIDYVVSNHYAIKIRSRVHDNMGFADLRAGVAVFRGDGEQVAIGPSGGSDAVLTLYKVRVQETGEWLVTLATGARLRARRFALPFDASGPDVFSVYGNGRPLPPGRYSLVGSVGWIEGSLLSEPIEVEVIESANAQDRGAAALVDATFAGLMCPIGMPVGLDIHGEPTGSVKQILNQFPGSIHARRARSRLLLVRASRVGWPQDYPDRAAFRAACGSVAESIERHLDDEPGDPMAPELLHARALLLRKAEKWAEVVQACKELTDGYPKSGLIEDAKRLLERAERERLYLDGMRLLEAFESSDRKAEFRRQHRDDMEGIVGRIEAQLAGGRLDDPDRWDLLKMRMRLLCCFEKMPDLIRACDDVIRANPQSKHAAEARRIRDEFVRTGQRDNRSR